MSVINGTSSHRHASIISELYEGLANVGSQSTLTISPSNVYATYSIKPIPGVLKVTATQIAEYLTAASLEKLSYTCKHFYHAFCGYSLGFRAGIKLYDHQVHGLAWMLSREKGSSNMQHDEYEDFSEFSSIRGGLFCDEPGLGKTITVLSLILRSIGKLPMHLDTHIPTYSERLRAAEIRWMSWDSSDRMTHLCRVTRSLIQESATLEVGCTFFCNPLLPEVLESLGMSDYARLVPHPISDLTTVYQLMSHTIETVTLMQFCSAVRSVFENAVVYHLKRPRANKPCPDIGKSALVLLEIFESMIDNLLDELYPLDKEDLRRATLIPSAATLIVVPPPMMEHWTTQITTFSKPSYLGAVLFDNDLRIPLPPPEILSRFNVIVTTSSRLSIERTTSSSLYNILFQRIIIDEGHSLGGLSWTNCGEVSRKIEAERRWIVSGTPTPETTVLQALSHIRNLLSFLRVTQWTNQVDWRDHIVRPFQDKESDGFGRLSKILSMLMLRHTKDNLQDNVLFPRPEKKVIMLDLSPAEAQAYDTLATFVQSNILLTCELDSKTSAWVDSLLNPAQSRFALEALRNLRLACCGGGSLAVKVTNKNVHDTLQALDKEHNANAEDVARIADYLRRANTHQVTGCDKCGRLMQMLLLTPCTHLMCPTCMRKNKTQCLLCQKPIDPDEFQLLQPGFLLEWHYAPPSRVTGPVGGPLDQSWEDDLHLHSKANAVINHIEEARERARLANENWDANTPPVRPVKAIIFSQFRKVLDAVGDKMYRYYGKCPLQGWLERGSDQVAEFFGNNRNQELVKFKTSRDCFVLLLNMDGSTGLDLSFVTHIYILEEIWNKALERQVIARAHRLGSTGPVQVVQLVMKDTIEEEMLTMIEDDGESEKSLSKTKPIKRRRTGGDTPSPSKRGKKNCTTGSTFIERDSLQQGKIERLLRAVRLTGSREEKRPHDEEREFDKAVVSHKPVILPKLRKRVDFALPN